MPFNGSSPEGHVSAERYLNHPTFGLLYRVAEASEGRDLYATLYAQRMFFLVTLQERGAPPRAPCAAADKLKILCTTPSSA